MWRRGIPISLAQLHVAVGRRAGLPIEPVGTPMVRAQLLKPNLTPIPEL